MKIIKKEISEKDSEGKITVIPEHVEDLWHLYNIISRFDLVRAKTYRKIEKKTSTGSRTTEKVRIALLISVQKKLDLDLQGATLRISGKIVSENQHVKLGEFHTLEIKPQQELTVIKRCWDMIHLQKLEDATDVSKSADVAAVLIDEGFAYICLISEFLTITKQKIEMNIPKKRYTATAHEKGLTKFFDVILGGIVKHVDFSICKCIIVASSGFLKDQFTDYIFKIGAQKEEFKQVLMNKSKFLVVHTSSGHRESLTEVLSDPSVLSKMQNTKAATEMRILEDFYDMLQNNPNKAVFGYEHVAMANEQKAIDILMVTDGLFKSVNVKERQKYVSLVENVKENRGITKIFSSGHVSGQNLGKLSGIAAILRFPIIIEEEIIVHHKDIVAGKRYGLDEDEYGDDDSTSSSSSCYSGDDENLEGSEKDYDNRRTLHDNDDDDDDESANIDQSVKDIFA